MSPSREMRGALNQARQITIAKEECMFSLEHTFFFGDRDLLCLIKGSSHFP